MTLPLFPTAITTLRGASERLQAWPSLTLWMACLACLPQSDDLTRAEIDEALQARSLHDLQGADAVEAIEAILAEQPGATVPAPEATREAPAEPEPEGHLRLALECLEKAIAGFGPCPAAYRLEFAAQDLRAVISALEAARSLVTEKTAEAA